MAAVNPVAVSFFMAIGALMVLARILAWPVAFAFAVWLLIGAVKGEELIEPTPAEYADIQKWIPQSCCWTQNCCKKVDASALIPLTRDEYRVAATGQVIARRAWSQDGNTWRCTCDHIDGKWVVSVTAKTHCIFPTPQGY